MENRLKRIEELQTQLNKEIAELKKQRMEQVQDSVFEAYWRNCRSYINWDKIIKVMRAVGWQYGNSDGFGLHEPSLEEIQKRAKSNLWEVYQNATQELLFEDDNCRCVCSCGGFEAVAEVDDKEIFLNLRFVVESWDSCNDD